MAATAILISHVCLHKALCGYIREVESTSKIKEKEYLDDQQSDIRVTSCFVQYPSLRHWPRFKERQKIILHWVDLIPDQVERDKGMG